ncbi:acetyl-CoA carboxylase biotin carboxyl carrier protein [Micromonospora purpureochromogenes]|uniref:Biotin carboxyl carrier protein of acetyl-CoA carboxylase n=1 Tax=Micromonospora purpureochromogenes TaxID=47872 RepID=A0ABX2RT46_9ACTN|nr:acetyl-CoA carboxylase biotin carboxyl carrier protein [Micromonospora purpureochromogenes]NYF59692.1 acetyl-CoA carboxylase biotin carboxyl carrier protein [Micromonospora purpureochromogenes]
MSAGTVPAGAPSAADGAEAAHEVDAVLAGLRRHARQLVAEVDGPVRRVRLRSGDTVLEVEWHDAAAGQGVAATETARALDAPAVAPVAPPSPRPALPAGRIEVRSPMVGTFYRAPEPGAAPFVTVGDLVRPGQVVGIVEAMKLMNEVTAERAGRVAEVLVDDGRPVEYDQPLVALDPA